METNSWDAQGVYVLEALKRIETNVESLHQKLDAHSAEEAEKAALLRIEHAKLEKETKIYVRVASGVAACVGFVLSLGVELLRAHAK